MRLVKRGVAGRHPNRAATLPLSETVHPGLAEQQPSRAAGPRSSRRQAVATVAAEAEQLGVTAVASRARNPGGGSATLSSVAAVADQPGLAACAAGTPLGIGNPAGPPGSAASVEEASCAADTAAASLYGA